ncbi:hypothetical protein PHYBLDRAFT_172362 [Phycomyces blakesleeanus NRRL 1555(-)]|uniref:Uncharacterized protein n=1 Tax=Phycomyces blakesleeanus (strain ATCC 8743b / DSM 1359 / FGSC 10004 / NBRC 33097 / NRRL 1555) TaxID=763407 RepID=A0A162TMQ0_PHYB8|nr:hypothetical protein PHYBLDRAFT_172362 [Phycomyces blakesleeanus NRRL 1555(-)]OAD69732.1 hypothetical protein PHYBLDRAFT_172362 [Phycomyces blakesleeanus NRRL 1555(-)]|eukprot:XP_018287772.1 hypothetical protein PHYBLDRAFT_172362 [Phycomyces blakesleeanus NRRL 1555(-)]
MSHCYHMVQGPINKLVYVETDPELFLSHLCSIAAGLVQFDSQGMAMVKVAKLGTSEVQVQSGCQLGTSEDMESINSTSTIKDSSNTSSLPTLSPVLFTITNLPMDKTLPEDQKTGIMNLLNKFCTMFVAKAHTVTIQVVCLSNLYHDESSSRSIVLLERSGKTN